MARPGARGQVAVFLPVPCRQRLAWPAASLVADALSNAFASGEEALTGLAEDAGATAEEAVSPFEDAAAEPPPEEHDMGGFDDLGDEI
jgi:hypothetical protein